MRHGATMLQTALPGNIRLRANIQGAAPERWLLRHSP
jgi:hypothetical protein